MATQGTEATSSDDGKATCKSPSEASKSQGQNMACRYRDGACQDAKEHACQEVCMDAAHGSAATHST